MRRRKLLTALGTGAVTAVAGCISGDDGEDGDDTPEETDTPADTETQTATETSDEGSSEDGATTDDEQPTLTIGTYSSFLDAPSVSPGARVKEEFESEFDATLEWAAPDQEINYYIERRSQGVDLNADMYLGLNTDELVRIDSELDDGLFAKAGDVERAGDIRDGLQFDPEGRALPFDTGYVSPVYDGTEVEAPETFDGLLEDQHEGDLIAQNPGTATTGRAFLFHTVHRFGEDGYLDYWADLQDNGVQILGSWSDAYSAWQEGEAPMVVSYSTDQVFAAADGADLEEHQIRFLDDQAYANPEGMAVFQNADEPELARQFMNFILGSELQGIIAEQNVSFPATDTATLSEEYNELAKEPPEAVTFSYDELQGSMETWVEDWERQFISN
ncbi:thiamine ABC transporter substrate-binding protein [Halovenus salina]|uniref:Thiamine ABC transporter substrate binding subunit n=1 Tax=Halovenus salina TaxID=1510225 RepID=A0ABD5W5V4_9EURY|nr:thiamine ABC transporter substrate-binding protein [Halovenus salina]